MDPDFDYNELMISIGTIPLYERIGIDSSLFQAEQVEAFNKEAEEYKVKYDKIISAKKSRECESPVETSLALEDDSGDEDDFIKIFFKDVYSKEFRDRLRKAGKEPVDLNEILPEVREEWDENASNYDQMKIFIDNFVKGDHDDYLLPSSDESSLSEEDEPLDYNAERLSSYVNVCNHFGTQSLKTDYLRKILRDANMTFVEPQIAGVVENDEEQCELRRLQRTKRRKERENVRVDRRNKFLGISQDSDLEDGLFEDKKVEVKKPVVKELQKVKISVPQIPISKHKDVIPTPVKEIIPPCQTETQSTEIPPCQTETQSTEIPPSVKQSSAKTSKAKDKKKKSKKKCKSDSDEDVEALEKLAELKLRK